MKILADGDACPVKPIISEACRNFRLKGIIVASTAHHGEWMHGDLEVRMVDNTSQAADILICNLTDKGDIVVTGDYGVAAMCLAKGARVISFRGLQYNEENIDRLLLERQILQKARRGGYRTKGPSAHTKEDDRRFKETLWELVLDSQHKEEEK